ncbi:hypothetical protein U3938_09755 [Escherichia coli]|nr:hypothetical protein [Escherichia coli]WRQ37945.1 hypothetical protein U3938_09755 [Escherichia coli]
MRCVRSAKSSTLVAGPNYASALAGKLARNWRRCRGEMTWCA